MELIEEKERDPLDRYYTPHKLAFAIARRARTFAPMAKRFLEPSSGQAVFIESMIRAWDGVANSATPWVDAVDLDPGASEPATRLGGQFFNCDFLEFGIEPRLLPTVYDVILGNPPFAKPPPAAAEGEKQKKRGEVIAQKHVEHMLSMLNVGGVCAVLLRSSFTSSNERYPLFERCPPILVQQVVERPSFTPDGKTDQHEYSAFYWRRASRLSFGDPGQTKLEWLSWK